MEGFARESGAVVPCGNQDSDFEFEGPLRELEDIPTQTFSEVQSLREILREFCDITRVHAQIFGVGMLWNQFHSHDNADIIVILIYPWVCRAVYSRKNQVIQH